MIIVYCAYYKVFIYLNVHLYVFIVHKMMLTPSIKVYYTNPQQ